VSFIAFEARNYAGVPPVDKDPAGYVREEEQRQGLDGQLGTTDGSATDGSATGGPAAGGAATEGSLSIGSLREG
jgi:hypothetical protein